MHYKAEYEGIGGSLDHPGGLAVVGHFLEVVDSAEEGPMDKFIMSIVDDHLMNTTESAEYEVDFNLKGTKFEIFEDRDYSLGPVLRSDAK